jgi:hypothetical protein
MVAVFIVHSEPTDRSVCGGRLDTSERPPGRWQDRASNALEVVVGQ